MFINVVFGITEKKVVPVSTIALCEYGRYWIGCCEISLIIIFILCLDQHRRYPFSFHSNNDFTLRVLSRGSYFVNNGGGATYTTCLKVIAGLDMFSAVHIPIGIWSITKLSCAPMTTEVIVVISVSIDIAKC